MKLIAFAALMAATALVCSPIEAAIAAPRGVRILLALDKDLTGGTGPSRVLKKTCDQTQRTRIRNNYRSKLVLNK